MIKRILKIIYLNARSFLLNFFLFFLSPRNKLPETNEIKKILIIRIDRIGDLVLSIPMIKSVRQSFPQAHLTVLVNPLTQGILKEALFVDEILLCEKGLELRKYQFDLVFDLMDDYTLKTAILSFQTTAPYRAGFDVKGRGVFFNVKVKPPQDSTHFVDQMLELVKAAGGQVKDRSLELPINSFADSAAAEFLEEEGICKEDLLICIHPCGHYATQRWLPERFAHLLDQLIQRHHAKIILMGSKGEAAQIFNIKEKISKNVIPFIGHPLEEWTALLRKADLLICNNSGILHMACAVKTPTISMMGPTLTPRWLPYGQGHIVMRKDIPCISCNQGACKSKTFDCMQLISVQEVLDAAEQKIQMIKKNKDNKIE